MSADNWAQCPGCIDDRNIEIKRLKDKLDDAYGTVPLDVFDAMRADYESALMAPIESTFREDYEIYGAEGGVVSVSYSGSCTHCGVTLSFSHQHTIEY